MTFFKQIPVGEMENFAYLIGCEETKQCAAIDPGWEAEKIIQTAKENGYQITKIFLTHVHYDHSGAADEIAEKTGARIFINQKSEEKRGGENPMRGSWIIPKKNINLLEIPLDKGGWRDLQIGNIKGKIITAPGHQSDHFLYIFDQYLFTGDTLFIGRIGRTDLLDSDPKDMEETLENIKLLPNNLIVCPGHDYGEVRLRKLSEEKEKNPYL